MFGLTFEKLVVVGLIAAVIIGPRRLPGVLAWVVSLVRGLRRTVDAARLRTETELGVPLDAAQWHALDPRQYDPRRIIAEALAAPSTAVADGTASGQATGPSATPRDAASVPADRSPGAVASHRAGGEAPAGSRRVRVGSSAHPRWIEVADDAPTLASPPRGAVEAVTGGAHLTTTGWDRADPPHEPSRFAPAHAIWSAEP